MARPCIRQLFALLTLLTLSLFGHPSAGLELDLTSTGTRMAIPSITLGLVLSS
jgi:hypothetical protein